MVANSRAGAEEGLDASTAEDDGHGNAVIAPDANHSITVNNVTVAQLVQHQGDFHFT